VRVTDWPDFAVRAMTLTLGHAGQMDFLQHTLRRVLPRQRVNMVFIGGASIGKVRWPSHPEAAGPGAFTHEQIRELADLARENFIEPVPHVQGFGHTGGLVNVCPELLAPKAAGRSPCFDITRTDARAFIFDLYADAIDAFQATGYFHVGFDEARGLELICGDRTHTEVVAEHITAVHGWLKARGLRMIMWADMLLDHGTFHATSAANSRAPHYGNVDTAPALGLIPKDILLANWYYGTAEEHPQIEHLQSAGFELFPTTWYKPENNFRLLRSSHQAGLKWAAGSSWMYCSATNPTMMGALLGEYAWTVARPATDQLNYDELGLLYDLLQPPRVSDRPFAEKHIDLSSVATRSVTDPTPGDGRGWLDLGPESDLSALVPGQLRSHVHDRAFSFLVAGEESARCVLVQGAASGLDGVPDAVTIPVAAEGAALVFLHAGTADSSAIRDAAIYEVVYADDTTERLVLRNAVDIAGWLKPSSYGSWRTARQQSYCRNCTLGWRGYTLAGQTVELSLTEWRNPRPDIPIREIRLTAPRLEAVALAGLTLLTTR
ncbi:MAG: family 20 glycosylhydrolase, partial [Lentisphaerae bacterium]|nr:family 20 glycosylhydrolase [Lentisphaerota bacterium]